MNALVISGGGAKGAFAGGFAEYIIHEAGKEYELFIGSSTGSLLVSLLAAGDLEQLRSAYCTIGQSDIFNICPFRIKKHKQGGHCTASINHFNIIRMFLKRKKTFGESLNLRRTIEQFFTKESFQKVRNSNKELIATVSNLSTMEVEYKSIHDCDYETYCDWIWASANMIPFMSIFMHNGMEYADGGIGNNIPIEEAIARGASCIDSIILTPHEKLVNKVPSRNVFDLTFEIFDFMLNQLTKKRLQHAMVYSVDDRQSIEINNFHTPRVLTENPLVFNSREMTAWWKEGYDYAQQSLENT